MNAMNETQAKTRSTADDWTLIRDVAVLQMKLVVDGFRDLLLLPAALIAGVVSLVSRSDGRPGPHFYQLLALGKQSEQWINLFGAIRNAPGDVAPREDSVAPMDIDDLVARVETFVVDEYKRGGVTQQAKTRLDQALAALQRRNKRQ